jgi:hypothetical protein
MASGPLELETSIRSSTKESEPSIEEDYIPPQSDFQMSKMVNVSPIGSIGSYPPGYFTYAKAEDIVRK